MLDNASSAFSWVMEMSSNETLGPSPHESENHILSRATVFLFSLLVAVIIASAKWKSTLLLFFQEKQGNEVQANDLPLVVPFILILQNNQRKPIRALYHSLEKYRTEASQALKGLSQHLEQAISLENGSSIPKEVRLSTKIRKRIEKLSESLDENERTLKNLLCPMDTVTALPDKQIVHKDDDMKSSVSGFTDDSDTPTLSPATIFHPSNSNTAKQVDENVYDLTTQIVAHLVRDWTPAGALIRKSLYDWVCTELVQRSRYPSEPVLVAGAGMGRLAYDIYSHGFTVEANELSPVMTAAANSILTRNATGTLHPFALDPMSNEVDSERRYDAVTFPDIQIRKTSTTASLSFTIGDFVGEYYYNQVGRFGAIVTCFFIDTATNIYQYIELTKSLLKPNGLWINVGPVQWHRNALLRPSADELKELISAYGFKIVLWKVDSKPVPYRQDDSTASMDHDSPFVRSTSFDAYRPLRFVAIRK